MPKMTPAFEATGNRGWRCPQLHNRVCSHNKSNGTKLGCRPFGFSKRMSRSGENVVAAELAAGVISCGVGETAPASAGSRRTCRAPDTGTMSTRRYLARVNFARDLGT
jgi:hypothetical protein